MRSGLHVRSLEGMTMKEYKLFKTAKKTAKENGLVLEDGTYLYKEKRIFDFSLLDKMDMPDIEKEVIRKCAIQTVSAGTRSAYHNCKFDNFYWCGGYADYAIHRVYSSDGRRLYCIFQIAKINHFNAHRDNVWEDGVISTYDLEDCYTGINTDVYLA